MTSPARCVAAGIALAVALVAPAFARSDSTSASDSARATLAGNYLAGRLAGVLRDNSNAADYLRAALKADPRNPVLAERTFLVLLADGEIDEAAALADRLIQVDRQHRIARLTTAVRAIKAKQFQVARSQLAQSLRGPVADLTATLLSAWTALGSGDAKSALELVDNLQGPDWYAIFRELHGGLIADLSGNRREAGRRLERAFKADPTQLRTMESYARWASRNGQRDLALSTYAAFDKSIPNHPVIADALDDLKDGKSLPPIARTVQEGAAELLYGLGSALSRQGGEDYGLIYLQLALYLAPEHSLALISLGDLFETLKKPEDAIDAYERVPASSPLKRNAEIQLALNLDQLERTAEARKHLETLVNEEPQDLEAVLALGNVLRARKQYAEAAAVFSKGIDTIEKPERRHWMIHYVRGICYERSKRWSLAEADLKTALKLYPEQPHVLNYLGYSWIDQGLNLDEGMEMIRRAVALRPDDGYIVDSLGWAYYRLGRYDEAVVHLERAIELKPDDPVINDHLGDAYWKVDRRLEATFQWNHARDLKPEAEDLARIEAKLKTGLRDDTVPKAEAESKPRNGG